MWAAGYDCIGAGGQNRRVQKKTLGIPLLRFIPAVKPVRVRRRHDLGRAPGYTVRTAARPPQAGEYRCLPIRSAVDAYISPDQRILVVPHKTTVMAHSRNTNKVNFWTGANEDDPKEIYNW